MIRNASSQAYTVSTARTMIDRYGLRTIGSSPTSLEIARALGESRSRLSA